MPQQRKHQEGKELTGKGTGFALTELLVVIIIVATLASIALPIYTNQSNKAKSTEALTQASVIFKTAYAIYKEKGIKGILDLEPEKSCTVIGAPENIHSSQNVNLFVYKCELNESQATIKIIATGSSSDSSIMNKKITFLTNLKDGSITKISTETNREFGGNEQD